MPLLRTRCILSPRSPNDGVRASVMSRHTLDDGKTPDRRIVSGVSFDDWRVGFSAPIRLIKDYVRGKISWEEYARQYVEFLREDGNAQCVSAFAKLCSRQVTTLLCIEESADFCHRRLLAEEMARANPKLKIEHA